MSSMNSRALSLTSCSAHIPSLVFWQYTYLCLRIKCRTALKLASMPLVLNEFQSIDNALRRTSLFLTLIPWLHQEKIHMSSSNLDRMELPIDHFFDLGFVCRQGRSFDHFTRREWHTPSSTVVVWRERLLSQRRRTASSRRQSFWTTA